MRKTLSGFTVVAVYVGLLWTGMAGTANALTTYSADIKEEIS